eukprot:c18463_g1_i2 orf=231-572(+)
MQQVFNCKKCKFLFPHHCFPHTRLCQLVYVRCALHDSVVLRFQETKLREACVSHVECLINLLTRKSFIDPELVESLPPFLNNEFGLSAPLLVTSEFLQSMCRTPGIITHSEDA